MKVVLKYRRGTRPRGAWRYPLWYVLGPHYNTVEADQLGPDWEMDVVFPFHLEHSISLGPRRQDHAAYNRAILGLTPLEDQARHAGHQMITANEWGPRVRSVRANITASGPHSQLQAVLFFATNNDREAFISVLVLAKYALATYAETWLSSNDEEPGGQEITEEMEINVPRPDPPVPWLAEVQRKIRLE